MQPLPDKPKSVDELSRLDREIISLLTEHVSLTISEMVERIDAPRSSVYQAVNTLVNYDIIRNASPHRKRNAKYSLGTVTGPNTIIPSLRWGRDMYKASFFLQMEEEISTEAFFKLIKALAIVMKQAEELIQGRDLETTEIALRRAKANLIEAKTEFSELADLANQILNEPRFWNPMFLEKFPRDDAWRPKYHHKVLYQADERARNAERAEREGKGE